MPDVNKMLTGKYLRLLSRAAIIFIFIGLAGIAYGSPHHANTGKIASVTVYLRYFDSSSIVALTESTLKKAYDIKFTSNNENKINYLINEVRSMPCGKPEQTEISDLRALIEFRSNDDIVHTWRASFFNYEDWRGKICKLQPSDRENLENLLRELNGEH